MKRKVLTILLCFALVLCMTACGNESNKNKDENEGQGSGAGNNREDGNKELTEITFVLDWTPNTNHTGLYVAQEKGYFEEAGLKVNIMQPPEDGAAALVAGGGAQFGVDFQDYLAPAFAREDPLPITAVAAVIQHNTSGFISLKENGIKSPRDMEGFTYASWDRDIEKAILRYIVEKDGGDYSKLKMIPSTVNDVITGLKNDVDLVWIYYAWDGIATQVQGIETNYVNLADVDEALDFYSPVIVANDDYLEENPEQAKAFLSAVKKGYEYAMENPEKAAEILCKAVPELDMEIVKESQKWLTDKYQADAASWGLIDGERWDGFYQWLYEMEVIDQEIPDGRGYSNDYLK